MRTAFAVALLACLAPSRPSVAEDDWVRRRVAASELLQEERWEEAAALVDPHSHSLAEAVNWAWNATTTADWDAVRRDRVRCGLMAFYVRYCGLGAGPIAGWGPEYVAALARLPEEDRPVPPLDFSHLELLRSLAGFNSTLISNADFDAALAAARQNPESIPAIAACLHCVRRGATERDDNRQADDLRALANVLTGEVGRLELARLAASGPGYEHRGLRTRMLEDGWRLAPTESQQAALLYALAEVHASLAHRGTRIVGNVREGLQRAVESATEVYQSFTGEPAAARARESAVRWTAQLDGSAAGLALVRDLQQAGDAQRAGLAEALYQLASEHYYYAKAVDLAEPLLQEIVRDYSGGPAARSMYMLALISGERGDEDRELHWLKRCADYPATGTHSRENEDIENTRSGVMPRLAEWHERHQQWHQALERWQSWHYRSSCGTGWVTVQNFKRSHIARCHAQLGDHRAAAAACLGGLQGSWGEIHATATIVQRLYTEAGQVDDLLQILDELDARQLARFAEHGYYLAMSDAERRERLDSRPLRTLLSGLPVEAAGGSSRPLPPWDAPPAAPGTLPKTLAEAEQVAPPED